MRSAGANPNEVERARRLVLAHGWNATSYQVLNPGIELWFAAEGDGVIGFVRSGRTRVVAGAPVCADDRVASIATEFERDAAAHREEVCYFAAESRLAAATRETSPRARLLLGAQPVWRPARLVATIHERASLRAQLHRARNKGLTVTEWSAERAHDTALRRCLAEWLATRGLPALHFLVETATLDGLFDRRLFVAERNGEPVAFLVATPIPARNGWLVEQIVRGRRACNGTSELLLEAAARAFAAVDARLVTLGLAPLASHEAIATVAHPWWVRWLFAWLRAHGRRFYDFRGLEAWKAKFRPEAWEPVYALAPGSQVGVRVLHSIAGAFARGSPALLAMRAAARAVQTEVRSLFRSRSPRALSR